MSRWIPCPDPDCNSGVVGSVFCSTCNGNGRVLVEGAPRSKAELELAKAREEASTQRAIDAAASDPKNTWPRSFNRNEINRWLEGNPPDYEIASVLLAGCARIECLEVGIAAGITSGAIPAPEPPEARGPEETAREDAVDLLHALHNTRQGVPNAEGSRDSADAEAARPADHGSDQGGNGPPLAEDREAIRPPERSN